jgi:hypothetical protein
MAGLFTTPDFPLPIDLHEAQTLVVPILAMVTHQALPTVSEL